MTKDQTDLARRLAAHSRFRWVAGMWCYWSSEPLGHTGSRLETDADIDAAGFGPNDVPDLSDYATAAILLRMAMEAARERGGFNGFARVTGDRLDPGCWVIASDHGTFDMSEGAEDLGTVAATALLAAWDSADRQEVK